MWTRVKWKLVFQIFFLVVFILGFAILVVDSSMEKAYQKSYHAHNFRSIPESTVAIVPGAAVHKLSPSHILVDRLRCALLLYQQKKVKKILLSGDHGRPEYNEVKPMLLFMLENGVDPEDIFVDYAGFRTLDTLVRAKHVYQVQDAVFVSQRFHQPRAQYIANQIGIQLYSLEADLRYYQKAKLFRFREFFARFLTWLDLTVLFTKPKYLGKPHPIQGSGTSTWKNSGVGLPEGSR